MNYCVACGELFQRPRGRGAPPLRCVSCRAKMAELSRHSERRRKPSASWCLGCGRKFELKPGRGRSRLVCSDTCQRSLALSRQRARRRARAVVELPPPPVTKIALKWLDIR